MVSATAHPSAKASGGTGGGSGGGGGESGTIGAEPPPFKSNVLALSEDELKQLVVSWGYPKFRATQVRSEVGCRGGLKGVRVKVEVYEVWRG